MRRSTLGLVVMAVFVLEMIWRQIGGVLSSQNQVFILFPPVRA